MRELAPIVLGPTGTVLITVQYPYRKTKDVIIVAKGHLVHCCICAADIPKTKRDSASFLGRITAHLCSHDRRKAMREHGLAITRMLPR